MRVSLLASDVSVFCRSGKRDLGSSYVSEGVYEVVIHVGSAVQNVVFSSAVGTATQYTSVVAASCRSLVALACARTYSESFVSSHEIVGPIVHWSDWST